MIRNDDETLPTRTSDVGCSLKCECGQACSSYNESNPYSFNEIGATCNNTKCPTCVADSVTCPDDTDCIITGSDAVGKCVDSGLCTAEKKTLCDEAFAVVTGQTNNRAKCCPATSSCVRTRIGVKATSTCSVNCGDCLSNFIQSGKRYPSTFCMFGQRLSEFAKRNTDTRPFYLSSFFV